MVVAIQHNNLYSSIYWTRSLDHMPVHREEHVLRSSNALAGHMLHYSRLKSEEVPL